MKMFEWNKISAAALAAILFTMVLGIVSDAIYAPDIPGQPGYAILVPETGTPTTSAAVEEEIAPIAVRLAGASIDGGMKVARKCTACHVFEQGGANRVGPALWDIVGRTPASHDDFSYSRALVAWAEENPQWDFDNLDGFLANPKKYISGTSMSFVGLKKPDDRADMIAYLRSLSDNPVPLDQTEITAQ